MWRVVDITPIMSKIKMECGFPGGSVVKNPPANKGDARDMGLISGSGRSPGVGNVNPLQYSCLENSMDRGAWRATVYGVTKESDTTECTHMQNRIYMQEIALENYTRRKTLFYWEGDDCVILSTKLNK